MIVNLASIIGEFYIVSRIANMIKASYVRGYELQFLLNSYAKMKTKAAVLSFANIVLVMFSIHLFLQDHGI